VPGRTRRAGLLKSIPRPAGTDPNPAMVSLDRQGDEGKDSPMVNRMRLEEQVDKVFSLARSKALLGHRGARLKRSLIADGLPLLR
jgi:hypothetical protein